MSATMKAIIQDKFGAPDKVLQLREISRPTVDDNEVLIRVRAASMHADIWHAVTGRPYLMRLFVGALRKPKHPIPGTDIAGDVAAIGKNVTRFKIGDAVFGESHGGLQWHNGGAYAEYVAAPEDALAPKPGNVTYEEAASVPTSGYIALINLQDGGQFEPGQRVLINGAGGGVGSIAIQLAKASGAVVTGVDSGEKLEMIRKLGADHLVDYTQEDFTQSNNHYDLILDVASSLTLSACKRVLTSTGRYVIIGHDHYGSVGNRAFGSLPRFFSMMVRAPFDSHLPDLNFSIPSKQEVMVALQAFLEAGQLTPIIDRTYPLSEVPAAMHYLQTGRNLGKIVITV